MIVFFYVFALASLLLALGVLVFKNPIHSALSLVGTFFCLAAIYVMLNAEFVAVVQVLVYAGAIMVLFLFVLMLLSSNDNDQYALKLNVPRGLAVATTGVLLVQILTAFMDPTIRFGEPGAYPVERIQEIGSIALIGQLLFTEFVLPFEVISILLLVAVIGAVIIAKRRVS